MTEESNKLCGNTLTAKELLHNRGIKSVVWDEYEKSAKILPKTGEKQFEPNGSWLENMQIEKGIKNCRDLIGIERVNRISQLASAEWLPEQRKARVKKHSGQEWSNFGLETNGVLYLIPEEALFLLEANCMELTWNDVSLSIQQAYELLIDNVECSMEEYRVYSQLVRYGYRLQRFVYERNVKKADETVNTKRKVIVNPENGLRMADSQLLSQNSRTEHNKQPEHSETKDNTGTADSAVEICKNAETMCESSIVEDDVRKIVEDLFHVIERMDVESANISCKDDAKANSKLNASREETIVNDGERKNTLKAEIISEETLLGDIKIVREPMNDSLVKNATITNWHGSRIQRNVKLLPKRTHKPSAVDLLVADANKDLTSSPEKRKVSTLSDENVQAKKLKQEVIELSDDEIQELPRPMTKTELLNLIPNIASQATVTVKISRGYVPHSIKPCKNVYQYENTKFRNLQETDEHRRQQRTERFSDNVNQSIVPCNTSSRNEISRRTPITYTPDRNRNTNMHNNFTQHYYPMNNRRQLANSDFSYPFNNRFPGPYNQRPYWQNGNPIFQRVFMAVQNQTIGGIQQNRFMFEVNNFTMQGMSNNVARYPFIRNQFRQSFHQRYSPQRNFYPHRNVENTPFQSNVARGHPQHRPRYSSRGSYRNSEYPSNYRNQISKPSFKTLPGAATWAELKAKWRDEKTITIDDEDSTKEQEIGDEVQVVKQFSSPLVGPKNAGSLAEVYDKLSIIKSAPEKTMRRKRNQYKISYNVYSNTQHYKKASPGLPLYRVIVIRQKDDPFVQPVELHRLRKDADNSPIVLACVSMSISYIQPGSICLPTLR